MNIKLDLITKLLLLAMTVLCFWGCPGTAETPPTGDIIYDIQGSWSVYSENSFLIEGENRMERTRRINCTFTGTRKEGVVTPEYGKPGTYSVGGESGIQVKFYFFSNDSNDSCRNFMGFFHEESYMEGTSSWVWSAGRN